VRSRKVELIFITDILDTIDKLLQKHEAIRGHIRSICSLMDCFQGDCQENIQRSNTDHLDTFRQKHLNLKQALDYLDEGLQSHQTEEEDFLTPLLGNPLIEVIRIEHLEMLNQLHEIKDDLNNMNLEAFTQNSAQLKKSIDRLCQLINTNMTEEDVVLRMLRKN
jgi:hypothetical protein